MLKRLRIAVKYRRESPSALPGRPCMPGPGHGKFPPGMNKDDAVPDLKKLMPLPLFAAMTAAGAYIAIPLPWSPVPMALQNFFALLAGLVLGAGPGAACMGLYLFLGLLGLPVFAGGAGGAAHFAGPTAGYLLAYPLAAAAAGLLSAPGKTTEGKAGFVRNFVAAAAGALVVYAAGVPWLKFRLGLGWEKAFLAGMLPFVPGDILKAAAAAVLAPRARRLLSRNLGGDA